MQPIERGARVRNTGPLRETSGLGPAGLKPAQLAALGLADMPAVRLEGADLTGTLLHHAYLKDADLARANLTGATLDYAQLEAANLQGAQLRGACLRFANLTAADLGGASLAEADLLHAGLAGANLRGTDLGRARLDHADFAGADLTNANLAGASLNHAKNLTRSQLKPARKSASTILPLYLQGRAARPAIPRTGARPAAVAPATFGPARIFDLSSPAFTERHAAVAGVVIAAAIVVGIEWTEVFEDTQVATLELGSAGKSAAPVTMPESRLRETALDPSTPIVDAGPRDGIAPPVDIETALRAETLRPVTKAHSLDVREIGRLLGRPVIASYYGGTFAGRPTASGETFNPSAMTAAHRSLPFGTRVHVTHARNGRSVIVRINDRGPFVKGRSIDLSAGAAKAIGLTGIARVHLRIVR